MELKELKRLVSQHKHQVLDPQLEEASQSTCLQLYSDGGGYGGGKRSEQQQQQQQLASLYFSLLQETKVSSPPCCSTALSLLLQRDYEERLQQVIMLHAT